VIGTGETLDEVLPMLPDDKVTFGVIKTSSSDAKSSFDRKAVCFFVYKGPAITVVKSAKFMARKLQVEAFCGQCTKVVAAAVSDDLDSVKDDIISAIKQATVDDSHDIGDSSFKVGKNAHVIAAKEAPKAEEEAVGTGKVWDGKPAAEEEEEEDEETLKENAGQEEGVAEEKDEDEEAAAARKLALAALGDNATAFDKAKLDPEGPPSAADVLAIVRDEKGTPFNWCLFTPSKDALEVWDAGSGSVMEMAKVLEEKGGDKLLYGLSRIAFGSGNMRRNYWFKTDWKGEQCSGVRLIKIKRDCEAPMQTMIGASSFNLACHEPSDISPEAVVAKVKSSCQIEGDGSQLSVSAFVAAYEEEQAEIRAFYEAKKKAEEEKLAKLKWEAERAEREAAEAAEAEERKRVEEEARLAEEARLEAEAREKAEREAAAALAAEQKQKMGVALAIKEIGEANTNAFVLFEIEI